MPTTYTSTDRLDDLISDACGGVLDLLKDRFVEDGSALPDFPDLCELNYSGLVNEIIDRTVPIYTAELDELAVTHHRAAMQALRDAFGSTDGDWPMGPFAAGLYSLIEQGVYEWYESDAKATWQEWCDALAEPTIRKAALVLVAARA